jgi:hypothetical protein
VVSVRATSKVVTLGTGAETSGPMAPLTEDVTSASAFAGSPTGAASFVVTAAAASIMLSAISFTTAGPGVAALLMGVVAVVDGLLVTGLASAGLDPVWSVWPCGLAGVVSVAPLDPAAVGFC